MNLKLVRKRNLSTFRKIAIGTWRTSYDPSVYGTIQLRMDKALAYLAEVRARTGKRVTVTHLVAKAAAAALRETPESNAILRGDRLYLREQVSAFFQVAISHAERGVDLSGIVIKELDAKPLLAVCDEFEQKVAQVRAGTDRELERARKTMERVPFFLVHWALRLVSFLNYGLNLDLSFFGVPRDAFGSIMITNVGSLGLDVAYPPLVAYARVPMLLAVGAVFDAPVVEAGAVVAGKVMNVSVTFDHRFIDGVHAAGMAKTLRRWIEDPYESFDALGPE